MWNRAASVVVIVVGASRVGAQPEPDATPAQTRPVEVEPDGHDQPATPVVAPTVTTATPAATPATPVVEPPDPRTTGVEAVPQPAGQGFRFGSYGRVIAGTDLRGSKPEKILIVAHGPRIVEDSYLELDFSYGLTTARGVRLRPVITLAFDGTLFHDTGQFDAHPALRNLFLDVDVDAHLTLWAGSRMYRGDDIYLFDYWPLDNQNTVGGGAFLRGFERRDPGGTRTAGELALHAGVNRLNDPFQFQQIQVANPQQGAASVVQLNRQRGVVSATASYLIDRGPNDLGVKLKLHGQLQSLPSGTRRRDDGTREALPADSGYLVGAEVSLFNFGGAQRDVRYRRHVNLFARYAKALAAFDELAPPTSFGADLKTTSASELSFGTSSNWDHAYGNVMIGALSRRFLDATGDMTSFNNGWEYAIDVRPLVRAAPDVFVGADVSYQARFPRGLNPFTERAEDPATFQLAPMIVYSPMGPSAYDRPQLRLVYRAAYLNQAALDLYVPDDPRHGHAVQHFLGVQAEWWFNSSTYR